MCANDTQADGTDSASDRHASSESYERRSLLKSALGFGAASALAGCGSDGGGGGTDGTTDPGTDPQSVEPPTEGRADVQDPTATRTDVRSHQGPSDGVTVVPPDGDIQAALEEAANGATYARSPWGTVRLQSGETYRVSETIEMPLYSVLDFNGARMIPSENVDVVNMSAGSRLVRPFIDAGDTAGWNSSLIKVTTRVKKVESIDPVYIDQMYLRAPEQQGTGVDIVDENEEGLWSVRMSGIIQQGEVGVHLHPEGEDSWVNSVFFDGIMRAQQTGVLMSGSSRWQPAAHRFDVTFQPSSDTTEWFWDLQKGTSNTVKANVWDSHMIEDETIWRVGEEVETNNVLVDHMGGYDWEENVVQHKYPREVPNGAGGVALFNWSAAQYQKELANTVDDLQEEMADLREQVNGN
jgi:hypothetical protein